MGESTHEWTKKQKISSKQIAGANAVCEDCGQKWTATLAEVPVTIFINDLDEYYKKLNNSLIEAVDPPMVLCVFRPSDREIWDTEITLSCIAPRQESPYNWRINHKHNGPAAASGCQIIPMKYNFETNKTESSSSQQEMVTIKEEIKEEEEDEIIEEIIPDPLADDKDIKPDVNSIAVSSDSENSSSCQGIFTSTPQQNPAVKRPSEELDDTWNKRQQEEAGYLQPNKSLRKEVPTITDEYTQQFHSVSNFLASSKEKEKLHLGRYTIISTSVADACINTLLTMPPNSTNLYKLIPKPNIIKVKIGEPLVNKSSKISSINYGTVDKNSMMTRSGSGAVNRSSGITNDTCTFIYPSMSRNPMSPTSSSTYNLTNRCLKNKLIGKGKKKLPSLHL